MSEQVAENPPEAAEKSQQQLLEQQKQRQEEQRAKQEQRKRLQEQARAKMEEDMKKLDEALKDSLSGIAKTSDNRSLAYTKLVLAQKQLERVFPSILKFRHIQYLDINTNTLTDASIIADFPNLIHLNISKNQIQNLSAFENPQKLTQLQVLNISGNKLKKLSQVGLPSLKRLNLTQNEISEVENWKSHESLQILQLRKNKLRKLKNIVNMKSLKELYVCQNQLTDIRGLQNLPSLFKLSVRANKITKIMNPFPYLPALQYLNLRQNQVAKLEQIKKIPAHVNDINMLANPLTQQMGQDAKKKIVEELPYLLRINKSIVTEEQRIAFQKQRIQRLIQQQKQRKQRQQQQRAKAAQGE